MDVPERSCVTRQALAGQELSGARQTVYETNSGVRACPQTGRRYTQPLHSHKAYSFSWLFTLAKYQVSDEFSSKGFA